MIEEGIRPWAVLESYRIKKRSYRKQLLNVKALSWRTNLRLKHPEYEDTMEISVKPQESHIWVEHLTGKWLLEIDRPAPLSPLDQDELDRIEWANVWNNFGKK